MAVCHEERTWGHSRGLQNASTLCGFKKMRGVLSEERRERA